MREKITTELIRSLTKAPPAAVQAAWQKQQAADIYDTLQPGLVLRARPNGHLSYRALAGRGQWQTLGTPKEHTPAKARELAAAVRGDVSKAKALGQEDPLAARRARKQMPTFDTFVVKHWAPWAREHLRSADSAVASVETILVPAFGTLTLRDITPFAVEKWRTTRLRTVTASTVNRNTDDLKAILNKAVAWKLLATNPIASLRRLRVDKARAVIRYLDGSEERRLLEALTSRDDRIRAERSRTNDWRTARGYAPWPAIGTYADHLHPFVLLLLHTGMRRGEAVALRWSDVNLPQTFVTVRGEIAKSGQSRVIPLNATIRDALQEWQRQHPDAGQAELVFPSPKTDDVLKTIKTAWGRLLKAAQVQRFRVHDCRHHFASKLVMAGVDLVTVQSLLGHSDIRMTMRYAHLAPEHRAAAVAKLVSA